MNNGYRFLVLQLHCRHAALAISPLLDARKKVLALLDEIKPQTGALIDKTLAITKDGHENSGYPTFSGSMYHAIAITEDALFITANKRHYKKTSQLGNIELLRNLS